MKRSAVPVLIIEAVRLGRAVGTSANNGTARAPTATALRLQATRQQGWSRTTAAILTENPPFGATPQIQTSAGNIAILCPQVHVGAPPLCF